MRALIQRVKNSRVHVEGKIVAEIGAGLLVFLGIGKNDTTEEAARLAGKIVNLRIFDDKEGRMNLNILQAKGEVLSVPQFTLYADTTRGNRPGFEMSAGPAAAEKLWGGVNLLLAGHGARVKKGVFAAHMQVELINDGPVTIWLDSDR